MALIGYARVSTIGQENGLETQKQLLKEAGCKKIFFEKVTGTSTIKRNELKEVIEFLENGDTLVVTKIDRLARSIIDLNKIVKELNDKGVNIRFLKENMEFNADKNNNSLQNLLFNILGSFAQFERDIIVERTEEGRARAKKQGKHMGRPAQDKKAIQKALKLYDDRKTNEMSVNDISKITGVPRSTIYAELKKIQE
ncbi:DNA invertase Pin-like site-specific DNA recombinase [Neobacillus niacini]|uniref:recombinase family protein n=1 Tax=Neobacillus driksii TaxID=3035913 RepID=UPI002781C71B|nr:recombinase family protein [Neobacillus niacini]MDQ0972418.1 DNA invertase Pin-like site-specific DNA recombinase [Neobacillus niacini]